MKDIKIHLIYYRTLFSQSAASLTMGSLAAYLAKNNVKYRLCLMDRDGLHNAEHILNDRGKINVVLAKPNFKDIRIMMPMLAELKKQKTVNRIFLCGPYASLNARGIIKDFTWLDGIIIGDAEETTLELVQSISSNNTKFFVKCSGGIWRHPVNRKVLPYRSRQHHLKLNDLPFPSRDIEKNERGRFINIESSRGCSGRCSFCHIPMLAKLTDSHVIDYRRPKLVVDEMEILHKNLDKDLFIFNDSCFWHGDKDNQRVLEFCREIKKRRLKIKFYIYLKCYPSIPEHVLKALADAGLVRVFLGIENAAQTTQLVFNKKIELNAYEFIKKRFDPYHINIHIGYIVVEPYTQLADISKNLKYLRRIDKLFRISVVLESVRVIPDSRLHQKLLKDGLIKPNLHYTDITYGYNYKHPETAKFMAHVKKLFLDDLKEQAYAFEYYCTVTELIKNLCQRWSGRVYQDLQHEFVDFSHVRDLAMDQILKYLLYVNKTFSASKVNQISLDRASSHFMNEFNHYYLDLKVRHAHVCSKIRAGGGERLLDCIYSGLDRI